MKRYVVLAIVAFVLLASTGTAAGQQGCEFNIIGTWKAAATGDYDELVYRFAPDGTLIVLSSSDNSEPTEIGRATYELDDPKAPNLIAINTTKKNRMLLYGKSSIKILERTEVSMTCEMPGYGKVRWTRVDPNRYFIILAARRGEFYDTTGSSFPILIKLSGKESKIDAVGIYSNNGKEAFGTVPAAAYKHFMREPHSDSEIMLRLEINSAQYERGLKILQTWERRVQEEALLYELSIPLNHVLLIKAITETLNQCFEDFKLYRLSYLDHEDWIADKYDEKPGFIPFAFFKELRRLNETRHVPDDKFPLATLPGSLAQGN